VKPVAVATKAPPAPKKGAFDDSDDEE